MEPQIDLITEEDIENWFEEEAVTPQLSSDASVEDLEEKFVNTQLRIVRTTMDFPLHNLRVSLRDPNYINFAPTYQRRDRWDRRKRSQLIESFLMNIPVPPVFLYENDYNQYEVMDGRQRLETIRDFLADGFRLGGLVYWKELDGLTFTKLPQVIQRGLLRRTLTAVVLLAETKGQAGSDVDVRMILFQRLNTGGVVLNPQELRNALYPSEFNKMLSRVSRSPIFTRIWGIPSYVEGEEETPSRELLKNALYKTMADCELVLRYFAIRDMMLGISRGGSLKLLLDRCMQTHQQDSVEQITRYAAIYLDNLATLDDVFEGRAFILSNKGLRSRPMYDAFMVALSLKGKNALRPAVEIREQTQIALDDADKYDVLVGRGNTTESTKERVNLAYNILYGEER